MCFKLFTKLDSSGDDNVNSTTLTLTIEAPVNEHNFCYIILQYQGHMMGFKGAVLPLTKISEKI